VDAGRLPLEVYVNRVISLVLAGLIFYLAVRYRSWIMGVAGLYFLATAAFRTDFKTESAWWVSMIAFAGASVWGAYHLFGHMLPADPRSSLTIVGIVLLACSLCKVALFGIGRARKVWTFTRSG
jgi:hypothetical protein